MNLAELYGLDTSPIESDWDDIQKLQTDIRQFIIDHPDCKVYPADDPGFRTRRIPRKGWVAYNEDESIIKEWTITLGDLKKSARELTFKQLSGREFLYGN
jgi:hypothetical protein